MAPGSTLPAGLSLNRDTGTITGTPTSPGTTQFTVQVTDHANHRDRADLSITLRRKSSWRHPLQSLSHIGTATLPYGSPGWFTGYQTPTVDANGDFSFTETVATGPSGPTPPGAYVSTYVEHYGGSSLSASQTFTVTASST